MALRVSPGSQLRLEVRTQSPDTLAPIAGLPVFVDLQVQPAAAFDQVAGAQTDAEGRAQVTVTVPAVEGSYRYRARTPGVAERFRADTSPTLTVEVVG